MARILLIATDAIASEITGKGLNLEAHDVHTAGPGEDGLETALTGNYELFIVDSGVPPAGGFDVCEQLKSSPRTGRVPLIMVLQTAAQRADCFESGASDYLLRPLEPGEIEARVSAALLRVSAGAEEVTGLPGNVADGKRLKEAVLSGKPFAYMALNVNGLQAFREVYKDSRYEEALRFTAGVLKNIVRREGGRRDLVSYLGDGTFSILTTPERSETLARSIIRLFDEGVGKLYDLGDFERGYITTFDRRGMILDNPIMTVSIGVAKNTHREISSHWEAAEIAREVLHHAMSFPGSFVCFDRRTDG